MTYPNYFFSPSQSLIVYTMHYYFEVALKLAMGLLALVMVINLTGKGNLAPTTAMEQIQNYVLGGIIGGVIYSKDLHTAHELTFKLRMHSIFDIRKVKRAVLEQNGQLLTVLSGEENLKYPLITDGTIQKDVLAAIDKDEDWLRTRLNEKGYNDISKLFLVDFLSGDLVVTPYSKENEPTT